MTRFVGILSGKGGVAKTTTVVNLGAAMNYFGRDVTIVDGNLSTPHLGIHLGVPVVPISLHDALSGRNSLTEAMYLHQSGMKIIPAGLSLKDLIEVDHSKLKEVLPTLEGLTDIVLVDASAGLSGEASAVLDCVQDVIVITNPELPAVTDALKTIKLAESKGKNVRGIIVAKTGDVTDIPVENIAALLEKPILAIIPFDKSIRQSLIKKDPVIYTNPTSKSAIAYKKLAADLIGMEYKVEKSSWYKFWKK
jgi:septum site-determining protein MinD